MLDRAECVDKSNLIGDAEVSCKTSGMAWVTSEMGLCTATGSPGPEGGMAVKA
jgi:hypothetical protein